MRSLYSEFVFDLGKTLSVDSKSRPREIEKTVEELTLSLFK